MITWEAKDAADVRPYGINWAPMLADGDTIVSASLTLVYGAQIDSQSNDDTTTMAVISGGVNGKPAKFTAQLVTTDGNTFNETIFLPIMSSACQNYMPSTATKRDLFEMAFEECGLPGYSFTAQPNEIASALRRLDATMRELEVRGIRIGYNFPPEVGASDPDDPALIPDYAITGVAGQLALKIAPGLGKTLSPEQKRGAGQSFVAMQAASSVVPELRMPRTTPWGSGNKPYGTWYPYVANANCC